MFLNEGSGQPRKLVMSEQDKPCPKGKHTAGIEGGDSVPLNCLTPGGTWGVPRKSRGNKVSHRVGRGTLPLSCSHESKCVWISYDLLYQWSSLET